MIQITDKELNNYFNASFHQYMISDKISEILILCFQFSLFCPL